MAYQQVPPVCGVYPPAQFTYPVGQQQQPATVYPPPQPGHQQTTVIVQQQPNVVVQPVVRSVS
jgi:hypothetical protein